MKDLGRACLFVQIIYVLGNDLYVKIALQFRQNQVSGIGLSRKALFTAFVVKIQYQLRILAPTFGRSYIFDAVAFPQTIGIAKGLNTAFGADTRARQDD